MTTKHLEDEVSLELCELSTHKRNFKFLIVTLEFIIQVHRLSTELITTSNKITGLEKVIEKVMVVS